MTEVGQLDSAVQDLEARHIIPLSGGKDSLALAIYLTETYPHVGFEYLFTDTGAELPEVYATLRRFEGVFGVDIERVTIFDVLDARNIGDRTPFDFVLDELYGGYLPSMGARWCTRMLKIQPFEWFIGNDRAYTYIGIRGDENREGFRDSSSGKPVLLSEQGNITPVYPFRELAMGLEDIKDIIECSGIEMPEYYEWRSRSGCYFCFYQQIGEWQGLAERHPKLFAKARAYEERGSNQGYTWCNGRSLAEIVNMPRREMTPADAVSGCAICHL